MAGQHFSTKARLNSVEYPKEQSRHLQSPLDILGDPGHSDFQGEKSGMGDKTMLWCIKESLWRVEYTGSTLPISLF